MLDARLDLDGAAVLDLYAGSGALGLEALSRGAASALFVEADRRAAAVISENIAGLRVTGAVVRCAPAATVLSGSPSQPVDLVFADPPYEVPVGDVEDLISAMAGGWVQPGTVVVIERAASGPSINWPEGWEPWRERRYGDTRVEFAELA